MIDTLFSTAMAVSALLALILLTRRAVAKHFGPHAAYALWLLPVARLFMPSLQLPSSWLPEFSTTATTTVAMPTHVWTVAGAPTGAAPAFVETQQADILWPLLLSIWIIGIVVGALWSIRSQFKQSQHLRRTTVPVTDRMVDNIRRAARLARLRKTPIVKLSTQSDGPLVCGLFRPVIVLPKDFTTQFTPTQQRLALLHEMTHLRRGDLWAATAMLLFRLATWPNPLIHWAWPRFRADQEAACDASVLRRTGETARADYAETLLTAAKTTGRATPVPGAGLSLSLNHPVKERLMTLGTHRNNRRGTARWALATLLLAGTAISAPLSFADDQAAATDDGPKVVTTKKMRFIVSDDETKDSKGFEVIENNGVKTYLRVSRDGTTEKLTREELEAEYGVDFEEIVKGSKFPQLDGEPGLEALNGNLPKNMKVKRFFMNKTVDLDGDNIEIIVKDGEKQAYRIEEDGTKTKIDFDQIAQDIDVDFEGGTQAHVLRLSDHLNGDGNIVIDSSEDMQVWIDGDKKSAHSFAFSFPGEAGAKGTESQLIAARSMIEASGRMIDDMKEDGGSDKDLRTAERELEKARKALDKAMEAVRKSDKR